MPSTLGCVHQPTGHPVENAERLRPHRVIVSRMIGPSAPRPFDPGALRLAGDLRRLGVDPRRDGWFRVRHGVWIEDDAWKRLTPVQRHAALVHASALRGDPDSDRVASHTSAAAVWGLPRVEEWPSIVHVTTAEARVRSSGRVRRHVAQHVRSVERQGLRVTTAARTVADVARMSTLAEGLAAADHALRFGLCTRAELVAELAEVPARAAGRVRLALVVDLADARSMSVGESLSRAQMYLLNVQRPDLQVRYTDEQGLIGDVDFGWDGVVGEFDGRVKYAVPDGATAAEAAEVLWREKRREDRLRRRVKTVARWTWDVALDRRRLGALLAHHGIRSQPRNTWLPVCGVPAKTA